MSGFATSRTEGLTGNTMETLLNLRKAHWLAVLVALIAGAATVLFLTGVLDVRYLRDSIPGEVLQNCGLYFATSEIAVAFFGVSYTWLVLRRVPDAQSVRLSSHALQKQIETAGQESRPQPAKPRATADAAGTPRDERQAEQNARGNAQPPTPQAADPSGGPQPATSQDNDPVPDPDEALPTGEDRSSSRAAQRPATEPGGDGSHPSDMGRRLAMLVGQAHPWLGYRLARVLPTLATQGPEAARDENRVASECDESDVVGALSPGLTCEWVLPLLGFLGTVWGLHLAIRPLSEGVELMMEAAGPNGTEAMREEAMGCFTSGFAGLRVAFDTTLVGLLGVVAVGSLLFRVRRRAMSVLGEMQWATEEILRSLPERSFRDMFGHIATVLQQGLLTEEAGQPQPRLGVLQETVRQSLTVYSGHGGAAVPWFQHVIDSVRTNVVGGLNVLVRLGAWQLHENRKQTQLQAEYIGPDLRALRRKALPEEQIMDDVLTRLRFDHVADVDQTLEIQALAVTNQAGSVAIGGYNRNAARRFLHEQRIDWLGRSLKVEFHPIFSEQVQDLLPAGDSEGTRVHEPTGDVLGLTYSPDNGHLYLLCIDGLVRRFSEHQMQEYGPFAGAFDREPFVWLPGFEQSPLVSLWRREGGSHRFDVMPVSDESARPSFAADLQTFLDTFERTRNQRNVELKVRADTRWICFSGRNNDQQRLVVCDRDEGFQWSVTGRLLADSPVTSFDVCQRRGSIVFAKSHEGIFEWLVGENQQPRRVIPLRSPRALSHLFLNADANVLVTVTGDQVAAHSLSDPQRPRVFETYGGNVTHAVQSLDRNSIAFATENNRVWLLNFRDLF